MNVFLDVTWQSYPTMMCLMIKIYPDDKCIVKVVSDDVG